MIKDPRMWQLVFEPTATSLCVMAFSPLEHHLLISETLPLADLEETIYDNPLLLGDFRKVSILIPADRVAAVPDVLDNALASTAFGKLFPTDASTELLIDELPSMQARLIYELPAARLGFLRRTFNNPTICHCLAPLARYFQAKYPHRSRGKMLANLRDGRCDIVVLGDDAPLLLNTYPTRDPMDAVYHIMAVREKLNIPVNQELIVAGNTEDRSAVAPVLRRYIRYVMPAIFPSTMFRAGRAALRTPFEMVIHPLTSNL